MHWSYPTAFLLLLGILLLLFRHRKPPALHERTIGSVELWRQLATRHGKLVSGTRWWQRPGLLWWFTGLLSLIFAAAGPLRWLPSNDAQTARFLVIDNRRSGSSDASIHWKAIQAAAMKIADSATESAPLAVLATAPRAHLVHPQSPDPDSLRSAIRSLTSQIAKSDSAREALSLAEALEMSKATTVEHSEVLWISNSLPPSLDSLAAPQSLRVINPVINDHKFSLLEVAISSPPENPKILYWQAGLQNEGGDKKNLLLKAACGGGDREELALFLQPFETRWLAGEIPRPIGIDAPFLLEVSEIGGSGKLVASVQLAVPPEVDFVVEIVGSENTQFWEAAFAALPGWTTRLVSPEGWEPTSGPDLRVLIELSDNEKIAAALADAPAWLVASGPFDKDTSNDLPLIIYQNPAHQAVRGAELEKITITSAKMLSERVPTFANYRTTILADSPNGPLLLAEDETALSPNAAHRWIAIAFHPGASNLPLRAAFPVLVQDGSLWLMNRQAFTNSAAVKFAQQSPGEAKPSKIERTGFYSRGWWVPLFAALGFLCFLCSGLFFERRQ